MNDRAKIVHSEFEKYGRISREALRKCFLLLPEIEKFEIWKEKGFGSIHEYAGKLAGMSRAAVDDGLRILRKIDDKPALQKIVAQKGINAVRPVLTIATQETASFWAEKAKIMSKNTLEAYVREFRAQQNTCTSTEFDITKEFDKKIKVTMELNPETAEELEKIKGQNDWNALIKELLRLRREKLESKKPEAVKTDSRHIPVTIQRYVLSKTNQTCAFPKCKKLSVIFHHIQRFALEKVHDPDRIVGLCKAHERIAHFGLIENEELSAKNWQIRSEPDKTHPKYKIDVLVQKYRVRT